MRDYGKDWVYDDYSAIETMQEKLCEKASETCGGLVCFTCLLSTTINKTKLTDEDKITIVQVFFNNSTDIPR
jgi:hypothetical protein